MSDLYFEQEEDSWELGKKDQSLTADPIQILTDSELEYSWALSISSISSPFEVSPSEVPNSPVDFVPQPVEQPAETHQPQIEAEEQDSQESYRPDQTQLQMEEPAPTKTKSTPLTHNILNNMRYILWVHLNKTIMNPEEKRLFLKTFGTNPKKNVNIKTFSALFGSPLQSLCIDFFESHAAKAIMSSRCSQPKKLAMMRQVGFFRKQASQGFLSHLSHK